MEDNNIIEESVVNADAAENTAAAKSKKQLPKAAKITIIIAVIFAVLAGTIGGVTAYINANQDKVASNVIYTFMPKSISAYDNGNEIVFYVEKNKDYKQGSAPLTAYNFYYNDADGKRVDMYQGHYNSPTRPMEVGIGFLFKAKDNIDTFKKIVRWFFAVISVAMLAVLIYVWFRLWSKKQDRLEQESQDAIDRDIERQLQIEQRREKAISAKKSKKKKNKKQ